MEFQQNWRFRFAHTPEATAVIVDSATPGRQWSIPAQEDGSAPDDYILICRLSNPMTGGLVLVAAGIKQFGTEAAGRELVDADRLGAVLRQLPAGWETRNLQVVLHARVINSAAGIPELVAWHVW
jgi:hypothetical protein